VVVVVIIVVVFIYRSSFFIFTAACYCQLHRMLGGYIKSINMLSKRHPEWEEIFNFHYSGMTEFWDFGPECNLLALNSSGNLAFHRGIQLFRHEIASVVILPPSQ
jgi:hypothetical protein